MSDKVHILYHHPCPDGCMAAAIALYHFGVAGCVLHPTNYKGTKPEIPPGSKVYFLDFSWPRAELERLAETCDVLVLDHHKTAAEALAGVPEPTWWHSPTEFEKPRLLAVFDQGRSGAGLTWDFFRDDKRPSLVNFVEDRDLWTWKLPESRAIAAWLQTQKLDPANYARLMFELEGKALDDVITKGQLLVGQEESFVRRLAQNVYWEVIEGHRVPVVNSGILQSELGEHLAKTYGEAPFAVVYYTAESTKFPGTLEYRYSFRSGANGVNFDVSEVAKALGGGGHRNAAGVVTLRPLGTSTVAV